MLHSLQIISVSQNQIKYLAQGHPTSIRKAQLLTIVHTATGKCVSQSTPGLNVHIQVTESMAEVQAPDAELSQHGSLDTTVSPKVIVSATPSWT